MSKRFLLTALTFTSLLFLKGSTFQASEFAPISTLRKCDLKDKVPESWKNDSLGCDGFRSYFFDILDTMDLKGYSVQCILQAFGNPNRKFDDGKHLSYYILDSCDSNFWEGRAEVIFGFQDGIFADMGLWIE